MHRPVTTLSPRSAPRNHRRRRTLPAAVGAAIGAGLLAASPAVAAPAAPELEPRAFPGGPPAQLAWTSGRDVFVGGVPVATNRRQVARLARGTTRNGGLALSNDGRFLVLIGDDGTWLIPVATGGAPVRLGDSPDEAASAIRWAPDSRRLLIVAEGIRSCEVEPAVTCRSAVPGEADDETGASWSPDSRRFAYVRERTIKGRGATEDLVTVDHAGSGAVRVIERSVRNRRVGSAPISTAWTRSGLVWSTITADRKATLAGRIRTRILLPDGRTRTLTAAALFAGRSSFPFIATGEAPDGRLLGLTITEAGREDVDVALSTVGLDGRLGSYGLRFRDPEHGAGPIGVLADGRVVVTGDLDAAGRRRALHLVPPGQRGLGTAVLTADDVTAAVAFPTEFRGS